MQAQLETYMRTADYDAEYLITIFPKETMLNGRLRIDRIFFVMLLTATKILQ